MPHKITGGDAGNEEGVIVHDQRFLHLAFKPCQRTFQRRKLIAHGKRGQRRVFQYAFAEVG